MNKEEIITKLFKSKCIYGTMYGEPYEENNRLVSIKISELYYGEWGSRPYISFIWGMPGPDITTYYFSDYGKTWAFTKKELEKSE